MPVAVVDFPQAGFSCCATPPLLRGASGPVKEPKASSPSSVRYCCSSSVAFVSAAMSASANAALSHCFWAYCLV